MYCAVLYVLSVTPELCLSGNIYPTTFISVASIPQHKKGAMDYSLFSALVAFVQPPPCSVLWRVRCIANETLWK